MCHSILQHPLGVGHETAARNLSKA